MEQTNKTKNEFTNPFAGLEKDEVVRSTLIIPHKIKSRFSAFDSKDGTIQTLISIFLTKSIHELERTIEPGDRYAFQSAIANCHIKLCDNEGRELASLDSKRSTAAKPATRGKRAKSEKTPD